MTIKRYLLVIGFTVLSLNISYAQANECSIHIDGMQKSILKSWRTDIYIYEMWNSIKNANLWTANNNTGKDRSDCYFNFMGLGIGTDIYKDQGVLLESNLGYSYGSLANTRDLFPSSNVKTHWITLDANISYGEALFYGGVTSSVFLRSSINNSDNYSFEGFYDDCFNRVTLAPYCGFRLRFQYLKFDARIGGQTISFLNANRIAYHNMHKTHVNGLYFELRLGVRLFSTSNPSRPINNLFLNI